MRPTVGLIRVAITQAGIDMLKPLDSLVDELHEQQFAHLSDRQRKDLERLLVALRYPPTVSSLSVSKHADQLELWLRAAVFLSVSGSVSDLVSDCVSAS